MPAGNDERALVLSRLTTCVRGRSSCLAATTCTSGTGHRDVGCAVLVDGHRVADAGSGARVSIRLGDERSLLGTLPDATFVRRYRQSFGIS